MLNQCSANKLHPGPRACSFPMVQDAFCLTIFMPLFDTFAFPETLASALSRRLCGSSLSGYKWSMWTTPDLISFRRFLLIRHNTLLQQLQPPRLSSGGASQGLQVLKQVLSLWRQNASPKHSILNRNNFVISSYMYFKDSQTSSGIHEEPMDVSYLTKMWGKYTKNIEFKANVIELEKFNKEKFKLCN